MAGLIGWVGREGSCGSRDLASAAAGLCHDERFRKREILAAPGVLVGAAFRDGAPPQAFSLEGGRVIVAVYGHPLTQAPHARAASPDSIGERYLAHGVHSLFQLDGSFVIVVADLREGLLRLVNDRTASLPMVYARVDGSLAFAPEAKALFGLVGMAPAVDLEAAVDFITCGYPLGDRTMFEGVRQLGPASLLDVRIPSARPELRTYWDLEFEPRVGVHLRQAADELLELTRDAHEAVLADQPRTVELLLTGGMDSRAILGTLTNLGRRPDRALTWGVAGDIPGSDPAIARQVAAAGGVPFRLERYDADTFTEHASEWCRISELTSDNMGNFAAGAGFLSRRSAPGSVLVLGDQMLGPGGLPRDAEHAVSAVTRVPATGLPPAFERMLRADRRDDVAQMFRRHLGQITSRCQSTQPKDLQDYLFFHLYVVRWLWAPAYFREPMVSVRRPLMLNPLIDFGATLPTRLRVDKRVLVRMMRAHMPELMKLPVASAHSLVDWDFATRRPGPVREMLLGLIDLEQIGETPLGGLIDRAAFEGTVASYFGAEPQPLQRAPSRVGRLIGMRRSLGSVPGLGPMMRRFEPLARRAVGIHETAGAGRIVRRVALLSLFTRLLTQGAFDTSQRAA